MDTDEFISNLQKTSPSSIRACFSSLDRGVLKTFKSIQQSTVKLPESGSASWFKAWDLYVEENKTWMASGVRGDFPETIYEDLIMYLEHRGWQIKDCVEMGRMSAGSLSVLPYSIKINGNLSNLEAFHTLTHELGHSLLHVDTTLVDNLLNKIGSPSAVSVMSYTQQEVEAESFAYILCKLAKINTKKYSLYYRSNYLLSTSDQRYFSASRVAKAVTEFTKDFISWKKQKEVLGSLNIPTSRTLRSQDDNFRYPEQSAPKTLENFQKTPLPTTPRITPPGLSSIFQSLVSNSRSRSLVTEEFAL
jgi:hypothetical protein